MTQLPLGFSLVKLSCNFPPLPLDTLRADKRHHRRTTPINETATKSNPRYMVLFVRNFLSFRRKQQRCSNFNMAKVLVIFHHTNFFPHLRELLWVFPIPIHDALGFCRWWLWRTLDVAFLTAARFSAFIVPPIVYFFHYAAFFTSSSTVAMAHILHEREWIGGFM